jgi:hypothetical protein
MRIRFKCLATTAALSMAALTVFARGTPAQETSSGPAPSVTRADNASPIYGVTIPAGYRQWELIAPSHEAILDELRGILGNPVAMTAYREDTLPFPDGTILAKVAGSMCPRFRTTAHWANFRLSFLARLQRFRSW